MDELALRGQAHAVHRLRGSVRHAAADKADGRNAPLLGDPGS
jgi:hypothetical protein